MKTMKRILFFVIALVSSACLNAQQVGAWRTHFVYNTVTEVIQTPNKVFALANGSMYSVDRRDKSIELYSKMSGLNDTDIATIAYNEQARTLVVAYANSNIDLITDDGIFNLPALFNQSITGSKRINSIYMDGNFAYLACDFGIVVLNLARDKREFTGNTYTIVSSPTGIPVSSITMSDTHIYAASGTEIYRALKDDRNLSNSDRWDAMDKTGMLRPTYINKTLAYWSGRLYVLQMANAAAVTGEVHWKADNSANWNASNAWTGVRNIRVQKDRLLMNSNSVIRSYNALHAFGTAITTTYNPIMAVEYLSREGEYWLAGNTAGLINWTRNEVYNINGPASKDARDIYTFGDKIFARTTGPWDVPSAGGNIPGAIMMYSTTNKTWSNIINTDIENVSNHRSRFHSLTSLAANPQDNTHFFASTWFGGVYEFRNGVFHTRYNSTNSLIRADGGAISDNFQLTYGLSYDNDGNLWFVNASVPNNPIKILKTDGTMLELHYPQLANVAKVDRIYIDAHNNKWVNVWRTPQQVFVFNENGTFNIATDDRTRLFDTSNPFIDQDGNSFFATARFFVEDRTGKMWIGTDSGPIIIENPANIFTSNRCTRIKVPRNDGTNNADYLLDDIQVNAIAVDGANRKWIGTVGSGVFLVSENGTSILRHFTAENSPLLSNSVNSLTLSESGELFIATDLGICSYQTDATEAGSGNNPFENVYAFPNPVTENYNGVISIVGLETDSNVKITDISGNIIYETTSRGGMATWDGRNRNGQKVASGIYLVYCANENVSETVATKIMIINR